MESNQICECGFTYQDWMDYDVICPAPENDELHLWEESK